MPLSSFAKLRNAAQHGMESSIVGKEGGLLGSADVLIGQGKLALGSYKFFFQSIPFSTLSQLNNALRHGTVFALRLDSAPNQKRNLSVVGALSRTFSTPSVSGPSYQIFEYHMGQVFAEPALSLSSANKPRITTSSGSKAALRDCFVDNWVSKRCALSRDKYTTLSCKKDVDSCTAGRMSLENLDRADHSGIYRYFVHNAVRTMFNFSVNLWSGWNEFHGSATPSQSAGAALHFSIDSSLLEDQLANSSASLEKKVASGKTLRLLSGSCYLPHPDKEETGGEDAHFICTKEHAVGVADGVGGWADLGIDAGLYARELMSNSVAAIYEEPKGFIDPARVLKKAHSTTKAQGSSTACIIALTNQGLHAINLGDSGFLIVRDGCTVFQSPPQQHDFNLTYQLECGSNGDLPSSGQVFVIQVVPGDVVVAGTDGLFDNLYCNEVAAVVVHALRAGFGPQITAKKLAALARRQAQDRDRLTPFSTAAQDAGIQYYGGKLDDITVVVSYIAISTNEIKSSSSASGSG